MMDARMTLSRFLGAVAAGTAALLVWGMVFWGAISPAAGMFRALPAEADVTRALGALPTGTYFVPWPMNTPETRRAFRDRHVAGGFYQLSFVREGADPQSGRKLLAGVLHHALAAALGALLLAAARPPTSARRFLVVVLAGSMAMVFATLGVPVWFHLPWGHALGRAAYELAAWALLGAVLAPLGGSGGRRRPR
jgi:hypothetical protein